LAQIAEWLDGALAAARTRGDRGGELRCLRDRAMVLLGFWRGFRGDELVHLHIENLRLIPDQGMTCFLPQSKGDRQNIGTTYKVPALSRWCPVTAIAQWLEAAKLTQGPLFRRIDHWGHVSERPLHTNSLVPLLRRLFQSAGVADAGAYSSHSLRRGFANWANANGWDIKALMEYVGWRDVKSAMRYLDVDDPFAQRRIERGLTEAPTAPVPRLAAPQSSD
jgi:integrase